MIETGAAVGRHHDHVDILLIGHLDDILERPAKLDDRAYLDQIDTVGKTVAAFCKIENDGGLTAAKF